MSPLGSRSSTPTAKAMATGNGRQATMYASPLARHRSYIDLTNNSSPSPPSILPRYTPQGQSTPTSSPPSEQLEEQNRAQRSKIFQDAHGRRNEYPSPSIRREEEDRGRAMDHRERSPLPRIQSYRSTSSNTVASLESIISTYDINRRGPPSPRLLKGMMKSGEHSTNSFDSEQLRSLSRRDDVDQQQRANSVEGTPFKKWVPFTSPLSMNRHSKQYVPTNLSSNQSEYTSNNGQLPSTINATDIRQGTTLQQIKLQSPPQPMQRKSPDQLRDLTQTIERDSKAQIVGVTDALAGTKRKIRDDESEEQSLTIVSDDTTPHSHFSSLAPPSSHLYGDMDRSRREVVGSATSVEGTSASAKKSGFAERQDEVMQEHDELEDDEEEQTTRREVVYSNTRTIDGIHYLGAPQRKSCDRCFKMKTKCSRAAPGTTGEGPCEGCIRRGFGDDCITSRPDFPYPRISLPKRARRESSLPALMNLNTNDPGLFVPSSIMQRSNDWRTKLIVSSIQQKGEDNSSQGQGQRKGQELGQQQQQQQPPNHHQSTSASRPVVKSQVPPSSRTTIAPFSSSGLTIKTSAIPGPPSTQYPTLNTDANLTTYVNKLRTLQTSELRDLSIFIAHEVSQRAQPAPLKTPVVPSVPLQPPPSQHPAKTIETKNARSLASTGSNPLLPQAMSNAPMQLLPKAVGLPALEYFDQLIFPLLPLPPLSFKLLVERYETYVKPGRNNIIELAMAIALQLQGVLLSCPDKSQANTAEGRIFKAFLQTSKQQQPEQHQSYQSSFPPPPHQPSQSDNKPIPSSGSSDLRLSIDSVKGWIEPGRHRSRAKDIVKHVVLRRCLKNGLDYDDVVENILLAYFYLIRGDVSAYHVFAGNAQRQVSLLEIQHATREGQWSEEDVKMIQGKVLAMERLHPINFFAGISPSLSTITWDKDEIKNDYLSLQIELSEIAATVQEVEKVEGPAIEIAVDQLLTKFRDSLPVHLQESIRNDWMKNANSNNRIDGIGGDWITDMIRKGAMTAPLRLNVCLNICFIRLVARQSYLSQAIEKIKINAIIERDSSLFNRIQQVHQISFTILSSTLFAFTIFPQLICLSQLYAADLTASAWSFIVSHLLLETSINSTNLTCNIEDKSSKLIQMEDGLTTLLALLESSQERESWPFAASLRMVKVIVKGVKERENGAKEWLSILQLFSTSNRKGFARLLMGDAWAVGELRKEKEKEQGSDVVAPQLPPSSQSTAPTPAGASTLSSTSNSTSTTVINSS